MLDTFNIVKVSDIADVDCHKIIKKCFEKPNMINYYYPHIFMNRDKINKEDLIKIFDECILSVQREKNVEHTIRKYNTLTNILESLFLCVFNIDTIKNIHKFIQYNVSKDDNIITDIVNHIINGQPLVNLEQLLNDKIDNSHAVFIVEKIVEHIKRNYTNDNLEKYTIQQYQLLNLLTTYISKFKYNPFVSKIINHNKKDIIKEYISKCAINDSHDKYISNIIDFYKDFKQSATSDITDDCDWIEYSKKINDSLSLIVDQKEKVMKAIYRITILDNVHNIINDRNNRNDYKVLKNNYVSMKGSIQSIINNNDIDKIIINSYINMIKNNLSTDKLEYLEKILKYFDNLGNLSKELIKRILPKYCAKENIKYYLDIVTRINEATFNKLTIINTIIDQQKKFQEDLKITQVENETNGMFDKENISLFNVDQKFVDSTEKVGTITQFPKELSHYVKFTKAWFDNCFSNLKCTTINGLLSNGRVQFNNTIINANLILLNALFMFNLRDSIDTNDLKLYFTDELVNDIVYTLEYYNLVQKVRVHGIEILVLNQDFFSTKQEIKVEFIKKVETKIEEPVDAAASNEVSKNEMIECYIVKSIKTEKIHKDSILEIVSSKCKFKVDTDTFQKCMQRLYNRDYYEIVDDHLVYVP
jgi:hypothetical protein